MKNLHYYSPKGTELRNRRVALSNEQIRQTAPAVFSREAHDEVSDRYTQVPTIDVVNALRDSGWEAVSAREQAVRLDSRRGLQRHELRFAHRDTLNGDALRVGDANVELVLTNSHDRSSAYQIEAGIYRPVCANGMIVCESQFERVSVRHVGLDPQQIIDVTAEVVESAPDIAESVDRYQQIELPDSARIGFAEAALMLRYDLDAGQLQHEAPVRAERLLEARRYEDDKRDLWTTLNVVQENVIRGGQKDYKRKANGRRFARTREVRSIEKDHRLNKALFHLAESIAASA